MVRLAALGVTAAISDAGNGVTAGVRSDEKGPKLPFSLCWLQREPKSQAQEQATVTLLEFGDVNPSRSF